MAGNVDERGLYMKNNQILKLNIKDAANIIGVTSATIRNWEKYGLITPKRRSNGYRYYEPDDISRMRQIKQYLIDEHYPLTITRSILESQDQISSDLQGFLTLNTESIYGANISSSQWGKKLRDIRVSKGLTLERVGRSIGVSPSYLSKIESSNINVSYSILVKLANYYGESLLTLASFPTSPPRVVHECQNSSIDCNFLGAAAYPLSMLDGKMMFPVLFVIQPHCGSLEAHKHSGEEFVYCLSGRVVVTLDETEDYILNPGDSFHFPATRVHFWKNPSNREAKSIWVYSAANSF